MGSMRPTPAMLALRHLTPTLRDVAAALGVSYATVRAYRQGTRLMPLWRQRRLATILRLGATNARALADQLGGDR